MPLEADAGKLGDIAVRNGRHLSLVVGRRGNHVCDSTAIAAGHRGAGGAEPHVGPGQGRGGPTCRRAIRTPIRWAIPRCGRSTRSPPAPSPASAAVRTAVPSAASAREFVRELAGRNLTTIRQRIRQHPEQTWEAAVAAMLPDKPLPPIPKPAFEPPMKVRSALRADSPLNGISAHGISAGTP